MNEVWIREQFRSDLWNNDVIIGTKIQITKNDVLYALNHIGKKKAPSVDGMSDALFEPSEWMRLDDHGFNPMTNRVEEPNNSEIEYHKNSIKI